MRIDALNQINQIYRTSEVTKASSVNKASANDKLEISQMGRDYQIAKQALAGIPDIREDKVNEVKAKMEDGAYEVSADELAEKLLNSIKNLDF